MDLRLLDWFVLLLFGLMVVYIGVCLLCFDLVGYGVSVVGGCCGGVVYLVSFGFLVDIAFAV